ncbi:glucose 1-dehydrogenase [Archangium lansingense]|uniref:Glucose 1-dehydrogenase n=1 Tax=Archangium lansingense TaxID=2995310 RepID=A0ABT3ZZN6_9BACT|nr:glucose 1-dehydrogenase [Archangium lansinium]MCY1074509.1 glucose 1-dehydrogenase [Archangium lansinium]
MAQKNPRDAGPKPPLPPQEQPPPGLEVEMTPEPDYGLTSYKGLGRLKDRVVLVTGGDSGIGRAVCLAFAREGADVAFAYLNEDPDAEVTRRAVEDSGHQVLALKGDLTDESVCRRIIEDTVKRFGRIDVLVNNAAYQGKSVEKFEELTAERIERTFRTNIIAMFHLVRFALPHMKAGGSIINVASIQAYQPSPGILDYASTKGAIVTFTKGLAQELIERGIRVNAVAPGPVWTPLIPQSFDAEKVKKFGQQSPMGRPAQPVELAPSFVFLASDESRYVNGEILGVTGGKALA